MVHKRKKRVTCYGCVHYYVTWDPKMPKGCRYFGIKSKKMPAWVVKENSGEDCRFYQKK